MPIQNQCFLRSPGDGEDIDITAGSGPHFDTGAIVKPAGSRAAMRVQPVGPLRLLRSGRQLRPIDFGEVHSTPEVSRPFHVG
jgi:hypothetical protein